MEEPFDELMGPPRIGNKKQQLQVQTSADYNNNNMYSSSIVTPEPSPVGYSTSSSRSGPPTNAFARNNSNGPPTGAFSAPPLPPAAPAPTTDRWNQFESDHNRLKEESARASATAVASASYAAAQRDANRPSSYSSNNNNNNNNSTTRRPYYDNPTDERLERAGASLPHPEEARGGTSGRKNASAKDILRNLSRSRQDSRETVHLRRDDENDFEDEVIYDYNNPERVRAEALKMLELADSKQDFSGRNGKKRVPAALAGLNTMGGSSSSKTSRAEMSKNRYRNQSFSSGNYQSDDEQDEFHDDIVDVVAKERGDIRDMGDESTKNDKSSSWSSRYSVSNTLASMQANRDHNRYVSSARNTAASPHQSISPTGSSSSTKSGGGVFGSKSFSFKDKKQNSPNNFNLNDHRTVWMDSDGNTQSSTGSRRSPMKSSWQNNLVEKRTRRRNCCIGAIIVVLVAIGLGIIFGATSFGGGSDGIVYDGSRVGQDITFYVTSDTPWDNIEGKKLSGDLVGLPGDADFAVHLGNIQDASVTLCPAQVYTDASAVLQGSPVPLFILPGHQDWNNCPNPDEALANWKENFVGFEGNFPNSITTVEHQLGRTENFSFIKRGVLFIGVHLVGGRVHDKEEWEKRHTDNIAWTEEKLSKDPDRYRAVVLMGNARPSQQQEDYFREVLDDIRATNKPVLYVHANGGGGFMEYKPFEEDAPNVLGVQLADGGKNAPLRVSVEFGNRPFSIGL